MAIKFVKVDPIEIDQVLLLFKSAAEKIAKKNIDHWQYWKNPPIEKIQWVEMGIANREYYFIMCDQGKLVGMVRIMEEDTLYWGENQENAKYIHSLVVTEQYEGQGLGHQIIQKIEDEARASNCTYLRLDCDSENPILCEYYVKQGFLLVGQVNLPLSLYNLYQKELDEASVDHNPLC